MSQKHHDTSITYRKPNPRVSIKIWHRRPTHLTGTSQIPLHNYANDSRTHACNATSSRARFPLVGFGFVQGKIVQATGRARDATGLPVLNMSFLSGGRFLQRDLFLPPHRPLGIGHTQYSIQTVPTKARRSAEMTPAESKVHVGNPARTGRRQVVH